MKKGLVDLVGRKVNDLTVLRYAYMINHIRFWECLCVCGKTKMLPTGTITTGIQKSCGCRKIKSLLKHGQYYYGIYRTWVHMKERCIKKNTKGFHNYGGRGITVCESWLDFKNFYKDMANGWSKSMTIDRIDPNGNYEPGNCRWLTRSQNAKTHRKTKWIYFRGQDRTHQEVSNLLGISSSTFKRIISLGYTVEDIEMRIIGRRKGSRTTIFNKPKTEISLGFW